MEGSICFCRPLETMLLYYSEEADISAASFYVSDFIILTFNMILDANMWKRVLTKCRVFLFNPLLFWVFIWSACWSQTLLCISWHNHVFNRVTPLSAFIGFLPNAGTNYPFCNETFLNKLSFLQWNLPEHNIQPFNTLWTQFINNLIIIFVSNSVCELDYFFSCNHFIQFGF